MSLIFVVVFLTFLFFLSVFSFAAGAAVDTILQSPKKPAFNPTLMNHPHFPANCTIAVFKRKGMDVIAVHGERAPPKKKISPFSRCLFFCFVGWLLVCFCLFFCLSAYFFLFWVLFPHTPPSQNTIDTEKSYQMEIYGANIGRAPLYVYQLQHKATMVHLTDQLLFCITSDSMLAVQSCLLSVAGARANSEVCVCIVCIYIYIYMYIYMCVCMCVYFVKRTHN